MDTVQLINDAKARFSHNSQKAQLKDKYTSKLTFVEQGGMWTANLELFTILTALIPDSVVIVDNYGNPVKVNRVQLLSTARQVYRSVMDAWYAEYESLKNNR